MIPAEQCVGWVLRRPETSATERLEALELQAQRLRAQYHLSAVELLLYELLLKVVYAVGSQQRRVVDRVVAAVVAIVLVPVVLVWRVSYNLVACLLEAQVVAEGAFFVNVVHADELVLHAPEHALLREVGCAACSQCVYAFQVPEAVEVAVVAGLYLAGGEGDEGERSQYCFE